MKRGTRLTVSASGAAALLGANLFIPLPAVQAAGDAGPSFDCRKATQPDEKAVCADPRLARLDQLIAEAYRDFVPEYGNKREIGRELAEARRACGADAACIVAAQIDALGTYKSAPVWAGAYAKILTDKKIAELVGTTPAGTEQPLPRQVGQCAVTSISALQTRFGSPLEGADPRDGSMVLLKNGGVGVSYSVEPELAASKVGQPVVTCLAGIPRDCPEGDERGRSYYTFNIATGKIWQLPDAQHMCGGA